MEVSNNKCGQHSVQTEASRCYQHMAFLSCKTNQLVNRPVAQYDQHCALEDGQNNHAKANANRHTVMGDSQDC